MSARRRFVAITTRLRDIPPEVLKAHQARMRALHAEGMVIAAGGFEDGGGLIMLDVASAEEAEALLRDDPFVVRGTHSYVIRTWLQDVGEA